MIPVAISGYGNIGKMVLQALQANPNFQLTGVIRRNAHLPLPEELQHIPVVTDVLQLPQKPSVIILCNPSRTILETAKKYLSLGIHTVDSYDVHENIVAMKKELDRFAKKYGCVSILSAGWDPGTDSMVRALLEICTPKGMTYTNFGPGMSMGHSTAVKQMDGVIDALSITIPKGEGTHRRMVYVTLESDTTLQQITQTIQQDSYFAKDETLVFQVEDISTLKDMGHGVSMRRKGVSGETHNQLLHFSMQINNPALTGQILVAAARAAVKQSPGAYTMIEIPPIHFLHGDKEELIHRLV